MILSFVASIDYENIYTTKISRFTVCERELWQWLQAQTPAHWTDRSKVKRHWALTRSAMQLARQLDSRADIGRLVVREVVDSVFGSLRSQVLRVR